MSSTGIIVGSIFGGPAFVVVETLQQARQVIAGFLDVVGACITNDQKEGELVGILKALVALDGRMDSALVLLHERVASTESNPQQPAATEQLYGDLIAIGSLLKNMSGSTKYILAPAHSSIETSHPDIVDAIRSAVQDFAALNKLCIEDIVAVCAPPGELYNDGAPGQHLSPPIPTESRDTGSSTPDESLAFTSPNSEEPEPLHEIKIEKQLEMDVGHRYPGQPNRPSSLNNRAIKLLNRFAQLGRIKDLEKSISYLRHALELCQPGHRDRSSSLNNLGVALITRFEQLGQIADLEQSILYQRDNLELCPPGHPDRSNPLNNLAIALYKRFGQLGQIADLEQSIIYHQDALELRPPGHPDRSSSLNNLSNASITRFDQLGQMADLEQSIIYQRDALELCPLGHTERSSSLNNLATALNTRFGQLGQMTDLEQSISYQRDALELHPPGHPDRSGSLNNLAAALNTRFEQLGQMADLEQLIIYQRNALELHPPRHPDRSSSLNNLANALLTRFQLQQVGQMVDLEKSISYLRHALELRPPGHPGRSTSLGNLANSLMTRFQQLGQMADLEQSILYKRDNLELLPPGHPNRPTSLGNLANSLLTRFQQLGQMADLEQSIIYQRDALALRPPGHPHRSTSLNHLASALLTRFQQLGQMADLEEAVELLQCGAKDTSDTPAHRYRCVSQLIVILEEYSQALLLETYALALDLLQLVLTVYPDVELRRTALGTDHLSPLLAMSAAAHAVEKGQPEKAVEMLEQGRGMLYSNIRGYRRPVEAVRQYDSPLADRFKAMSDELEALATSLQLGSDKLLSEGSRESVAVSDARWKRQRELNLEREDIIQQIRCLPGFEHFLKAVPFSELWNAAAEGPVIIVNVAELRSDAIILHHGDPPIVLPMNPQNSESAYLTFIDLSKRLFEERGKDGFSKLLEKTVLKKLDELLVTPVLKKLASLGVPKKSRIWWCPTSALCALPIHAAGKLPMRYISSYTPTLSALISARTLDDQQPPAPINTCESKPSLLAIVYPGHPPKTEDEHDDRLHTVDEEYEVIKTAAQAGQARGVVRPDPTREAALAQLPYHRWVHFACHGRLNTSQPFHSAFELQDDLLSLSDLVHARLPNADFAFLAACDSATSGGTTSTPDESLHLAAAVQFCGVRSVVGTLWPMADVDGPRVAHVFYQHMFKGNDSRKSAEALHKVVTTMKNKTGPWENAMGEGELLQRWANYIHIGA